MKHKFQIFIFITFSVIALLGQQTFSQQIPDKSFSDISESRIPATGKRYTIPEHYRTLKLNKLSIDKILNNAPDETPMAVKTSPALFAMPMPDGSISNFRIVKTQMMESGLALQYPEITTYGGQGIDDPTATLKLDMTPHGFHAMVISSKGSYFLDPYSDGTTDYYFCYDKKDLKRSKEFICGVDDVLTSDEIHKLLPDGQIASKSSGTQLRTYRLALAATGEYTAFQGGTVALALAAMVTTMNRVNGVYESEVAVRLILVANNNLIVYTDAATDPYSNFNGGTMLGQNQSNLTTVIGSANYDMGHVFSTGGGGIAGLGVICSNTAKARGVTGLPSPVGDAFDIDYVAHEMGHQFGGNHTFNSVTSSCGGNRAAAAAFEPGSGITIMAYAGICGSDNLAPHSIAYFSTKSFDEIVNYTTSGTGNTCPVRINTGNAIPVVSSMGSNISIPVSTPFILTGAATDADNDPLTYSWEEFDLGSAGAWNVQSTTAPMFRPFSPDISGSRTFPKLTDIINNTITVGELLPSNARTLKFRLTVRDNKPGGAGVSHPDTTLNINVVNNGGPFTVTAPNTADTWASGSTQTVSWNVNGTNLAPINCANVKISLSTDGGSTFPTVILASTPNDGSENITVPFVATTQARIKVEAADNIFFDMSNVNFTITFTLLSAITTSTTLPVSICTGSNLNVDFTANGVANAGNFFSVQLSNASGSFASPVVIGTMVSQNTGSIACTIPANTAVGNGYRIRVIGSNPAINGSDNGGNISVNQMAQPFIIASGPAEICSGQQLQLFTNASGNSIRFDGINDYLLGPNDVIPVTGDYTVSVWAKQANPHPGQFSQIIAQGRNFYIGSSNTGTIRVGDSWANTGIPFPTDGQWHFYTVVRTTTNTFLYLDGSLAATKGSAIPPPDGLGNTFPHTLMIGTQWMPIEYFDGYIDDVQIWNAARTASQILIDKYAQYNASTPGLVAYYPFNEGTGATTFNAINNGTPLSFTNGPVWQLPSNSPIGGNAYATYQWSSGSTAPSATINSEGTYTVTITDNKGCSGIASQAVIVHPIPTAIVTPSAQQVCTAAAMVPIVLSSNVSGTTFTWTKVYGSATGLALSGSGDITGTPTIVQTSAQLVLYDIVPRYINNILTCTGPTERAAIIVNPLPGITPPANQAVCNNSLITPNGFNGPVTGTGFSWSNNNTSIGLAASGVGNIGSFTGTNPTNSDVSATITVTPLLPASQAMENFDNYSAGDICGQNWRWSHWGAQGCGSVVNNIAYSGSNSLLISGPAVYGSTSVDNLYYLGNQTTGEWDLSFKMYVPAGKTANYNMQHWYFTQWGQQVYFASNGTGVLSGVAGATVPFTYPQGQWFEVKQLINQNTDQTSLSINGVSVASWRFSNMWENVIASNVIGGLDFFAQTNLTPSIEPNIAASGLFYIDDISLTSLSPVTQFSCPGNPATFNITVHPTPEVSFSNALPAQALCGDAILLSGGLPAGGTYSGPGVNANLFDPSVVGPGVHPLTYTYASSFGCINSTTNTILVNTPLSYVYNVGIGGDFPDLTGTNGLFAFLSANRRCGNVTAYILNDLNESGLNGLNESVEVLPGGFTIVILPSDNTTKLISGNVSQALIRLNGIDRISIDGGIFWPNKALKFRNSNTNAPTLLISSGVSSANISGCEFEGSNTNANSGVIALESSIAANSGINFTRNIIGNIDEINVPSNLFISTGSGAFLNSNVTFNTNEFRNYNSNGISVSGAGNGNSWNIQNNSFYSTIVIGGNQAAINFIPGSLSTGNEIKTNYIGGSTYQVFGTPMTNSGSGFFKGISCNSANTIVSGNTISNIKLTNIGMPVFSGIEILGGAAVVGQGNIIGSISAPYAISIHGAGTFEGIKSLAASNVIIVGNKIANINFTSNSGSPNAICLYLKQGKVDENLVFNIGAQYSNVSPFIIGVKNESAGIPNSITNNMIALKGGNSANPRLYGIYDKSSGNAGTISCNTVSISGIANPSATNLSSAFYRESSATLILNNNILFNSKSSTLGAKHYAVYSTTTSGLTSNYNDLYSISPNLVNWAGSVYTNLTNWKSATAKDLSSISITPVFNSATDLHLTPANSGIDNKGTPLSGIVYDFDAAPRSSLTPDIGADEFVSAPAFSAFEETEVSIAEPALKIYPNPVSTNAMLVVSVGEESKVNLNIYNIIGELVLNLDEQIVQKGDNNIELNASMLRPGLYICTMLVNKEKSIKKLIEVIR